MLARWRRIVPLKTALMARREYEVFKPNLQGEELKSAVLGEMRHYAPEKSDAV
jgi:hypothetical protein